MHNRNFEDLEISVSNPDGSGDHGVIDMALALTTDGRIMAVVETTIIGGRVIEAGDAIVRAPALDTKLGQNAHAIYSDVYRLERGLTHVSQYYKSERDELEAMANAVHYFRKGCWRLSWEEGVFDEHFELEMRRRLRHADVRAAFQLVQDMLTSRGIDSLQRPNAPAQVMRATWAMKHLESAQGRVSRNMRAVLMQIFDLSHYRKEFFQRLSALEVHLEQQEGVIRNLERNAGNFSRKRFEKRRDRLFELWSELTDVAAVNPFRNMVAIMSLRMNLLRVLYASDSITEPEVLQGVSETLKELIKACQYLSALDRFMETAYDISMLCRHGEDLLDDEGASIIKELQILENRLPPLAAPFVEEVDEGMISTKVGQLIHVLTVYFEEPSDANKREVNDARRSLEFEVVRVTMPRDVR